MRRSCSFFSIFCCCWQIRHIHLIVGCIPTYCRFEGLLTSTPPPPQLDHMLRYDTTRVPCPKRTYLYMTRLDHVLTTLSPPICGLHQQSWLYLTCWKFLSSGSTNQSSPVREKINFVISWTVSWYSDLLERRLHSEFNHIEEITSRAQSEKKHFSLSNQKVVNIQSLLGE
jgi:hypothetical protein